MVEPCLLAREIDVALDIEAASFILSWRRGVTDPLHFKYSMAAFIASPRRRHQAIAYVIILTP